MQAADSSARLRGQTPLIMPLQTENHWEKNQGTKKSRVSRVIAANRAKIAKELRQCRGTLDRTGQTLNQLSLRIEQLVCWEQRAWFACNVIPMEVF